MVGSAVNGTDFDLALELRGRLNPGWLECLAVPTPGRIKFHKPEGGGSDSRMRCVTQKKQNQSKSTPRHVPQIVAIDDFRFKVASSEGDHVGLFVDSVTIAARWASDTAAPAAAPATLRGSSVFAYILKRAFT